MNSRDQEQVELYRRYLLEKADRSGSRLIRAQILRWVERGDAARFDGRAKDESASEEMTRSKAA